MKPRKIGWTIGEGALSGGAGTSIAMALIDYLKAVYPEQPPQLWVLLSALFGAILVGGVAGTSKTIRTRSSATTSRADLDAFEDELEKTIRTKGTEQ